MATPQGKIALLFLTIADVHFPAVWDEWLRDHEDKVDVFIHAKYPSRCGWRTDRILPETDRVPTEWGNIVRAYASLFRCALRSQPTVPYCKLITLSESDIPLWPFADVYTELSADPQASMYTRMPKGPSEWDKSVRMKRVPAQQKHSAVKHNARFALCSVHAQQFFEIYSSPLASSSGDNRDRDNNRDKEKFKGEVGMADVSAGDEFCLSPILSLEHGSLVHSSIQARFIDRPVTHDNWAWTNAEVAKYNRRIQEMYERTESLPNTPRSDATRTRIRAQIKEVQQTRDTVRRNPKTVRAVTPYDLADMRSAQRQGALFYRKFATDSNIADFIPELWAQGAMRPSLPFDLGHVRVHQATFSVRPDPHPVCM